MKTVCFGLLVVFFCQEPKQEPVVVGDFCTQVAPELKKFQNLTDGELAALGRPRKEAILSLREKHRQFCQ